MSMLLRILNTQIYTNNILNTFSTTSVRNLDQYYRKRNKLPRNPNRESILTHRPDYSFTDGRPTPVGVRQRTRMEKQHKYAQRILTLTTEIDQAVKDHQKSFEEKEKEDQMILDRKLKPKGDQLNLPLEKKV